MLAKRKNDQAAALTYRHYLLRTAVLTKSDELEQGHLAGIALVTSKWFNQAPFLSFSLIWGDGRFCNFQLWAQIVI